MLKDATSGQQGSSSSCQRQRSFGVCLPGKSSGSSAFSDGSHAAGGFALPSPSLASWWLIRPVPNCPVLTCRSQLKTLLLTQDTSEAARLQSRQGSLEHRLGRQGSLKGRKSSAFCQLLEQNERDRGKINISVTVQKPRSISLAATSATSARRVPNPHTLLAPRSTCLI